jgi:protein phosphatase
VLRAYGVTDKGRVRPTNQDCLAIDEAHGLCVVADGMGGHNAGEIASRTAVEAVVEFIADPAGRHRADDWPFGFEAAFSVTANRVRTAIHLANQQVLERSTSSDAFSGMGTTIVAAVVDGNQLSIGYVGDSRLYIVGRDGIRLLTRDDSWVASVLAQDPLVDAAMLRHHPMRNALTNVVGSRHRTDVHVVEDTLLGDELLLLTTDGVHGVLENDRLERLLRTGGDDLPTVAQSIVAAALARGSRDNCTALVARYVADQP